MIPLTQTIIDRGRGNCLATCVASILEIPLETVPNFSEHGFDWWEALQSYLGTVHGLVGVRVILEDQPCLQYYPVPGAWCILTGRSPNLPGVDHAVVGKAEGLSLSIHHDPHPMRQGLLGEPKTVIFFARLDPAFRK